MQFFTSQKSKVDIHLSINRWKCFKQHWNYVTYLIWVFKGINLYRTTKDLGQQILEKDWIEPLQIVSGRKRFLLVLSAMGLAMHLTMSRFFFKLEQTVISEEEGLVVSSLKNLG